MRPLLPHQKNLHPFLIPFRANALLFTVLVSYFSKLPDGLVCHRLPESGIRPGINYSLELTCTSV